MVVQMKPTQSRRPLEAFNDRVAAWTAAGMSFRAATVLANAHCDTADEVHRLGRAYFEGRPNCADKTLAELAVLGNWPPKHQTITAIEAIACALGLSIGDADE